MPVTMAIAAKAAFAKVTGGVLHGRCHHFRRLAAPPFSVRARQTYGFAAGAT
jgi:hypothetical protein